MDGYSLVGLGMSHVGNVRKVNEDCFYADANAGLWIVADGLGGLAYGDEASRLACDTIVHQLKQCDTLSSSAIDAALVLAHKKILRAAAQHTDGKAAMGTTVVTAIVGQDRFQVNWVGDSRAYLCNSQGMTRLTTDHSVVQEMIDAGSITPQQAKSHPQRHVINQYLGADYLDELDIGEVVGEFGRGDTLLLCSDGLTEELDEQDIYRFIQDAKSIGGALTAMVDGAREQGGRDNITAVLITCGEKV